jgi:hypothetical protein
VADHQHEQGAAQPGHPGEVGGQRFRLRDLARLILDELIQQVNLDLSQGESLKGKRRRRSG